MASVIIPAHNESSVIKRCIDSVIHQADVDQIIVACNGCTDDTAEQARTYGDAVLCLDIAQPSKVNALNEAEKYVTSWPVFYLDADIELVDGAISRVVEGMQETGYLLAAPEPVIRLQHSSWLVQQYYKVWYQLPYIRSGIVGTCSFVATQEGRQRFDQFPDVISDDGFIRAQFEDHERGNISGSTVIVHAPRNLRSLVKIKTRSQLGLLELKARGLMRFREQKTYSVSLSSLFFSRDWLAVSIYVGLAVFMKLRARRQFKVLDSYQWEVDRSSR